MGARWSKEDLEYLEKTYGKAKIKNMARRLNRSQRAITKKAFDLGLKMEYSDDGMPLSEFRRVTNIPKTYLETLIQKHNLPSRLIGPYRKIYPNRFWEWAKENQEKINWGSFPESAIGQEPRWVSKARQGTHTLRNKGKPWSKLEDQRLEILLKENKYSHAELAEKFGRTTMAIDTRAKVIRQREKELENKNLKEERFINEE